MKKKSPLKRVAEMNSKMSASGVIRLLIEDHKAMRELMKKIKSSKSSPGQVVKAFQKLEDLVHSHVSAEESALLHKIENHPRFDDEAEESLEEHRVHEYVLAGIKKLRDQDRRVAQMKIFCEVLEHHLDEEEEDLFPKFKKYAALKTRKKLGAQFLKRRIETASASAKRLGALSKKK